MNQAQALEVVRSLANGVDPDTGEVFSAESPYQRPQQYAHCSWQLRRWSTANALNAVGRVYRRKPARRGRKMRIVR